jgi:3-hydroxy-9,10-secoandrosta-1,3,5(10)-triene-9,17-dione monooxygenase reductase component
MTMALRQIPTDAQELATFKQAMRHLIGGVSVITAGSGEIRTGLTATSAISLSLDPPTMLVCVNRDASAWPVIQRERHYCVNILDSRHQDLADRFAGRGGINGAARYEGARWRQFATLSSIARSRKSSNATATRSSSAPSNGSTLAAAARPWSTGMGAIAP